MSLIKSFHFTKILISLKINKTNKNKSLIARAYHEKDFHYFYNNLCAEFVEH